MTSTVTDSDPLAPYTLLYIYGGCCCVRALFQPTLRFSSFVSRERAKEKGPLSIIWRRRDHGPIIPSSPSISIPAYPLRRAWPSLFFCPSGLPLAARSIPSVLLPFSFLSLSMCVYIQLSSSLYDNAHGTTWKSPIPWQFLVDSIRTIRLIRLIYALNT